MIKAISPLPTRPVSFHNPNQCDTDKTIFYCNKLFKQVPSPHPRKHGKYINIIVKGTTLVNSGQHHHPTNSSNQYSLFRNRNTSTKISKVGHLN